MGYATPFKTEEFRSAQLHSLAVPTGSQLVQALGDWGMQETEERGLGYQGGGVTQRASLPESPVHL